MLFVDIIIVVILVENLDIFQVLIDEIYKEVNVKKKCKIVKQYFIYQIIRLRKQ